MTIKCSVFIATSLDGFIAREDGSIDWLMKANASAPPNEDGGYKKFISTVDRIVMGRNTFEKVLEFDPWPYGELPVIVMSSHELNIPKHLSNVSVSSESPKMLVQRLSQQGEKHLYIDGGITVQRFLAENLINDITMTIAPVLLGSGKSLFGKINDDIELQLIESRSFGNFVQMKYSVI